jgi:gamma-glutamyltranspeptidase/glutathione hydrolase
LRARISRYAGAVRGASVDYRGASGKTGPWGQGRCSCSTRLLEQFDLAALDPAGADALHLWLETAKLAFADRDACYGDPRFADVPIETLLSREYAAQRRALVDREKASLALRPVIGRLPAGWPLIADEDAERLPAEPGALVAAQVSRSEPKVSEDRRYGRTDTTQCVAVDAHDAVSATPAAGS